MCGILGISPAHDIDPLKFTRARDSLFHRGPTAGADWFCPEGMIRLGHRRLAILDLSPAGGQPMVSSCGKFVLVFNGEIYNHLALRTQLGAEGLLPDGGWKGHSDTETLVACFSAWGFEPTLKKLVGMFALALWDRQKKTIALARDRMGEKPLYYGIQDSHLVFSSELKALRLLPSFQNKIDVSAASLFLHNNYIPSPFSIYQGISKLPPGTWIEIPFNYTQSTLPPPQQYWSAEQAAIAGFAHPFGGSFEDAREELESLLKTSIRAQMIADVSVGAFLSGGVDSSTIVALMRECTKKPVVSLSIGVPGSPLDESAYAAAVAKHLGTHHIELHINKDDILSVIPDLFNIWDEPLGDSSQIPTWIICKLAKEHVTVALSGDGGDELFFGYQHHSRFTTLWKLRWLRNAPWNLASGIISRMGGYEAGRKLNAFHSAWKINDPIDFIGYLSDLYRDFPAPTFYHKHAGRHPNITALPDMLSSVALRDMLGYLPDDILVKVDRAAMNVSLETRSPFLDHRVVEFALSLPTSFKRHNGTTKRILRQTLYRHVPKKLIERPKQGFSIPVSQWLKNDLKEWGEEMMHSIRKNPEFWNIATMETMWKEHQSGSRDHSQRLWGAFALSPFIYSATK